MNEDLWKTLTSINEWVRFSEGKAVALLAAQGVLVGLLSQDQLGQENDLNTIGVVLGGVAITLNAASMLFAFFCLNPRLKLRGGVSPLYFGSIAASFKTSVEYYDYYKNKMADNDAVSKELCGQIFVNSQIADRKYKNVAYSIRLFLSSALFWFLFILTRLAG